MTFSTIGTLVLIVCFADAIFILLSFLFFRIARKFSSLAHQVFETGIILKGTSFNNKPDKDTKTHKSVGCLFLYGKICWYLASFIFALCVPIFTGVVLYLTIVGT